MRGPIHLLSPPDAVLSLGVVYCGDFPEHNVASAGVDPAIPQDRYCRECWERANTTLADGAFHRKATGRLGNQVIEIEFGGD